METQSPPVSVQARTWAPRAATAVLVAIAFLHNLDRTVMSGMLQPIKLAFHLSDAAVGALSGFGFGIAYATLGLPFARLADVSNRKRLLTVALGLWSTLTAVCGLAGGFWSVFLARLGVGVCEAAGAPAMHALIAEAYPQHRGSSAASAISLGMTFGAIVGVSAGGVVAERFGWRPAFLIAGTLGVVLTPMALVWLREGRGRAGPVRTRDILGSGMGRACLALLRKPAFLFVLLGSTTMAFWLWGTAVWFTTFLVRSERLSLSQAALGYGVLSGVSTAVGVAVSGRLGDRLVSRDRRWLAWVPALATAACFVIAVPVYLVPRGGWALGLYVLANVFTGAVASQQFAAVYALTGRQGRALGVSILNFLNYFVGLGVAPAAVGAMSDGLARAYGASSLKLALLAVTVVLPLAAGLFWLGARTLREDIPADA